MKTLFLFLLLSVCHLFAKSATMPVFPEHMKVVKAFHQVRIDTLAPVVRDTAHISLPDSLSMFIYTFLPDKGNILVAKYEDWIKDNIPMKEDSLGNHVLLTPGARHTCPAEIELLLYAYRALGDVPEKIVAHPNAAVQEELMRQLIPRRMDVVLQIKGLTDANEKILQDKMKDGYERLWKLKN